MLLWQEYRAGTPDGYGYSRFCKLYEAWESRLSPTMRQVHPAGERLVVDYAGQTIELVDGRTGEVNRTGLRRRARRVELHLCRRELDADAARLGRRGRRLIGAHERALTFFGVPRQIVPDNLKAGVLKANWHEPGLRLPLRYGDPARPATQAARLRPPSTGPG
jgi:transposase